MNSTKINRYTYTEKTGTCFYFNFLKNICISITIKVGWLKALEGIVKFAI